MSRTVLFFYFVIGTLYLLFWGLPMFFLTGNASYLGD